MYTSPASRKKYKIVKTHGGNAIIARYDSGRPQKLWVLRADGMLIPNEKIENHRFAHFLAATLKESCIIDATFKEALRVAKKIVGFAKAEVSPASPLP